MNAIRETVQQSLSAEFHKWLGGGLDVDIMDRVLDRLFDLACQRGFVCYSLPDLHTMRVETPEGVNHDVRILRAKTKLRMLCARLAARCAEWSKKGVSLYGDTVEVEIPDTRQRCRVHFDNTVHRQRITIRSSPSSRSDVDAAPDLRIDPNPQCAAEFTKPS